MQFRAMEQKVARLEGLLDEPESSTSLESDSPAMQRVIAEARQFARSESTILLRGESGTGKGMVGRAIHAWSECAKQAVCHGILPNIVGAIVGKRIVRACQGGIHQVPVRDNPGRIAACEGGTLFLDEIGDLPRELQPKLLRLIQDRQYERVGDPVTRRADVRLVTATNVNLEDAVKAGTFREDLLYRIKVMQTRPAAIAPAARRCFETGRAVFGRASAGPNHRRIHQRSAAALSSYAWPGNIRELRNVIERATILCQAERIGLEHLPANFAPQENRVNAVRPGFTGQA